MPKPGLKEIYQVRSPRHIAYIYMGRELTAEDPLLQRLKTQCDNMQIPTASDLDSLKTTLASSDVILDAIFGFSFKPPVRAPFDEALPLLTRSELPIVSVDIPSELDVEGGRPSNLLSGTNESGEMKVDTLDPDVLVIFCCHNEGFHRWRLPVCSHAYVSAGNEVSTLIIYCDYRVNNVFAKGLPT